MYSLFEQVVLEHPDSSRSIVIFGVLISLSKFAGQRARKITPESGGRGGGQIGAHSKTHNENWIISALPDHNCVLSNAISNHPLFLQHWITLFLVLSGI